MVQFALTDIIKEATLADPERGLELLTRSPWSDDRQNVRHAALEGYLAGLDAQTDWRATSSRLTEIITKELTQLDHPIDEARIERDLAVQWSKNEPSEALDWYFHEENRRGDHSSDSIGVAMILKSSLEVSPDQAFDWIEENQQTASNWNDQILVYLGKTLAIPASFADPEPHAAVPAILAMIPNEPDRFKVVDSFVQFYERDQVEFLRYSPDDVRRLVEAGRLSEENRQAVLNEIKDAKWMSN